MLPNEIITKGFLIRQGGGNSVKVSNALKELLLIEVAIKHPKGKYEGKLKERIVSIMSPNDAKEQETQQVYDCILMEMLK